MSRNPQPTIEVISFGQLIKKLRESSGLQQRKVAAILDIDSSTLSKIEKDERNGNLDIIKKLSILYNISQEKLLVAYLSDKIAGELKDFECCYEVLIAVKQKIQLY